MCGFQGRKSNAKNGCIQIYNKIVMYHREECMAFEKGLLNCFLNEVREKKIIILCPFDQVNKQRLLLFIMAIVKYKMPVCKSNKMTHSTTDALGCM